MRRSVLLLVALLAACSARSSTPSSASPGNPTSPPAAASPVRRGPCLALAECRAACGTGEPCARLAEFELNGWAGQPRDVEGGRARLERACREHHVPACQRLYEELEDESGGDEAERRLVAEAEAGCAADDPVACGALASAHRDRATNEHACDLLDPDACNRLLLKPLAGDFEDLTPWRERFTAGARARCLAGDADMCFRQALRLRLLDDAADGDPELAAQLREVTGEDPRDAAMYLRSAIEHWEAQCDGGWPLACWNAAGSLSQGIMRDDARSRSFGRRACALGVTAWCDAPP